MPKENWATITINYEMNSGKMRVEGPILAVVAVEKKVKRDHFLEAANIICEEDGEPEDTQNWVEADKLRSAAKDLE